MSAGNMVPVLDVQEIYNARDKSQVNSFDISTSAAESSAFTDMGNEAGTSAVYLMWSTVACHWKHNTAASGTACTANNGIYLPANMIVTLRIHYGDVINALGTASGRLKFVQINR